MSRSVQYVGSASGAIAGSVDVYGNLPTPLVAYVGVLYYVSQGSGGFLSWVPGTSFYKYPAGLYAVNSTVTAWELSPINVDLAQDTTTLLNIDDWAEFYAFSKGVNIKDKLIYDGIEYENVTGSVTTTDPKQDGLNWDVADSNIIRYYNDTGVTIEPFQVLHLKSATSVLGKLHPTPELADASKWELTQGTLSIACETILPNTFGCSVIRATKLQGGDTSNFTPGSQLWLTDDGSGYLTTTKPQFPNTSISFGGNYNQAPAPNGEIIVNQTTDIYDIFNDGWNGSITESFDFRTSSDGITVKGTLTNASNINRNLTLYFSTGFYTLDTTTTPLEVNLVSGTVSNIQMNYVFIDVTTKTLQTSTTGFPLTEHCKVAVIGLLNASITQNDGALINRNINDHIKTTGDNGHILHIAERIRALNAEWDNGTAPTLSGFPTNVYVAITSGQVWQAHLQVVPAQDMALGDEIHVVNDPNTPYRSTSNLNDITVYSTGSNWNNDWSNIVVWGVANKSGEPNHLFCNLPSAGYNSEDNAIEDRNNFTNYTIPKEFKGAGFLIGRFTIRRSGTSFEYNSSVGYLDLRGTVPNNTAGGGTGSSGVTELLQLNDTPATYAGQAGKLLAVNAVETAMEFIPNTKESVIYERPFAGGTVTSGAPIFEMANTEVFSDSSDIVKVSNSKLTLKAGSKYRVEAFLNCTGTLSAGYVDFLIYNATDAVDVGTRGTLVLVNNGAASGSTAQPVAFIVADVDKDIELQHRGGDDVTGYYSSIVITKL